MTTEETLQSFRSELSAAETPEQIQDVRVRFSGKKSYVKTALKSLGAMSAEERPRFAKEINDAAAAIEQELGAAEARTAEARSSAIL